MAVIALNGMYRGLSHFTSGRIGPAIPQGIRLLDVFYERIAFYIAS
jgi:hypothetical protein